MRVAGISYGEPYSSAVMVEDGHIRYGAIEQQLQSNIPSSAFPDRVIAKIKRRSIKHDYLAFTNPKLYNDFKRRISTELDGFPVLVDEREALAMSSIITKKWDKCAVIVSDYKHTSLGYYSEGTFYWLREFMYPTSLALFFSSNMATLGYEPVYGEQQAIWDALESERPQFDTTYAVLRNNVVNHDFGDLSFNVNFEKIIGPYYKDNKLARTILEVYLDMLYSLGSWLYDKTGLSNVAFAGISANNFCAVNTLSSIYSGIAAHTAPSGAAKALGAAACVENITYENAYIGEELAAPNHQLIAGRLLEGKVVNADFGKQAYSINSLGNRSKLCLPFKKHLEDVSLKKHSLVCQKRDFDKYFEGVSSIEDISYNTVHISQYNKAKARSFTVTPSSNPDLNRIIELTRAQGYPVVMCLDR